MGNELRSFKCKKIDDIPKIVECFTCFYKSSKFENDLMLYIPSNKNMYSMDCFAKRISDSINLPLSHNIKFTKNIKEQKHLEYLSERENNVIDAFSIEDIETLKNKSILIIDDVYASGATIKEIIRLLLNAKIERVMVIVFAYREHTFL